MMRQRLVATNARRVSIAPRMVRAIGRRKIFRSRAHFSLREWPLRRESTWPMIGQPRAMTSSHARGSSTFIDAG
jgi:hypothetical protein